MRKRPFTGEDARRLRFVRRAGFVGDGRHLFYTTVAIEGGEERERLWLFDIETAATVQIAQALRGLRAPAPSPDGSSIAVLAELDDRRQLFLVPIGGGQARRLTTMAQGVAGGPVWSPDGHSIAFAAASGAGRDRSLPHWVDRTTFRFDGLGDVEKAVTDLFVVDVRAGTVTQITDDRCMNTDPAWSPDGQWVSYLVSFRPDEVWDFLPELHVVCLETNERHPVVDEWGGVFRAEWCSDGDRIAFIGAPRGDGFFTMGNIDLWTIGASEGQPECHTADLRAGAGMSLIQTDLPVDAELAAPSLRVTGQDAYIHGRERGELVVYRAPLDRPDGVQPIVKREGSAFLADFDPDRGALYHATSFVDPPELMLGSRRVTALNDGLRSGVAQPEVRALTVTAPDGLRSDAWALTPGGPGPWPSILCIHGGPYYAYGSAYVIDFHLLVGAGFAVVLNNFRGSSGYGPEFSRSLAGEWGRRGSIDHLAAIDEAVAAGVADPDRIGVWGISHGGFATCWLLGTTKRFKAGVAENPLTNFASSFYTTDTNSWISEEFPGTPEDVPLTYRERSPLAYAANCTTPLLFIVGESDLRCPPAESEQYFRVLKSNDVPTEMLRLPNSAHNGSATGPVAARLAQNAALVEWFARYLRMS